MKVKSYREQDRKAKLVTVYLKDKVLELHPMYFNGKYLTCRPEKYMFCSLDPEDIKKTVLEAFERCIPD